MCLKYYILLTHLGGTFVKPRGEGGEGREVREGRGIERRKGSMLQSRHSCDNKWAEVESGAGNGTAESGWRVTIVYGIVLLSIGHC